MPGPKVNLYLPFRYHAETGEFEIEMAANLAGNVFLDFDSEQRLDQYVKGLHTRLELLEKQAPEKILVSSTQPEDWLPGQWWYQVLDERITPKEE